MKKQIISIFSIILILSLFVSTNKADNSNVDAIDYCQALYNSLLFYRANRASGFSKPETLVPWRNDSVMTDGSLKGLDLTGGYFDAGDYIKITFPMAYTMTVLAWGYINAQDNIVNKCQVKNLYLDTLKHGTDWLMAAHPSDNVFYLQVGDVSDHTGPMQWVNPWEISTPRVLYQCNATNPSTEATMEAAAALAASSIIWSSIDSTYSAKLLGHAKSLYNFGKTYQGSYVSWFGSNGQMYASSGYTDEMSWASVWMYLATGANSNSAYRSDMINNYNTYLKSKYFTDTWSSILSWDSKWAATVLLLNTRASDVTELASDVSSKVSTIKTTWLGATKQSNGIIYQDAWGNNRYAMNAAYLMSLINTSDSNSFAQGQLTSVLGASSTSSQSYMVGWNNGPKNPHHRASHQPDSQHSINSPSQNVNLLVGALVGGGSPGVAYSDDRTNYQVNEPAMDYNAAFTGLLALSVTQPGGPKPDTNTGSSTTTSTTSSTSSTGATSATTSPDISTATTITQTPSTLILLFLFISTLSILF